MKTTILALALTLISFNSFADRMGEQTEYKCDQFSVDGHPLLGVSAPLIVMVPNDLTAEKELFVKTRVVAPNAQAQYELLTKTHQGIEGSEYESQSFNVSLFYMGGARGHIERKVAQGHTAPISNCVAVK